MRSIQHLLKCTQESDNTGINPIPHVFPRKRSCWEKCCQEFADVLESSLLLPLKDLHQVALQLPTLSGMSAFCTKLNYQARGLCARARETHLENKRGPVRLCATRSGAARRHLRLLLSGGLLAHLLDGVKRRQRAGLRHERD